MSDKTTPKQTKADLRKMLAEAVLNTPGATQLEPLRDPPSEPKPNKQSASKRVARTKQAPASSSRKTQRAGSGPAKRR